MKLNGRRPQGRRSLSLPSVSLPSIDGDMLKISLRITVCIALCLSFFYAVGVIDRALDRELWHEKDIMRTVETRLHPVEARVDDIYAEVKYMRNTAVLIEHLHYYKGNHWKVTPEGRVVYQKNYTY